MKVINSNQFMDLGNKQRVAATAIKAVSLLYTKRMYSAVTSLITAYIDWMAGGSERKYKQILTRKFPLLVQELSPKTFYDKYRCGMLHGASPRSGYALIEEGESDGKYINEIKIEKRVFVGLNIDRLVKDFVKVAKEIAGSAEPEGK